jgi:hypothetical protein
VCPGRGMPVSLGDGALEAIKPTDHIIFDKHV